MVQVLANRRVSGFLLLMWCSALFVFSSIPGNEYPQVTFPGADKLVHIQLYLFVGLFAAMYFLPHGSRRWIPLAFGFSYGLSDEIHQLFVPLRTFSLADLMADTTGVVLGILIFGVYQRRLRIASPLLIEKWERESPGTL